MMKTSEFFIIRSLFLFITIFWMIPAFSSAQDMDDISPECKSELEYGRLPPGEFHVSHLSECIYDFLAFIHEATLVTPSGLFSGNVSSFYEKHMAFYMAYVEKTLWEAESEENAFTTKRVREALARAEKRERRLSVYFIEANKDRRRYYVDKLSVEFQSDYHFDTRQYTITAQITCDEEIEVFYELCDLKIEGITHQFDFHVDKEEAEHLLRQNMSKTFEIKEKIFISPYRQGIYKPSWFFSDIQYHASAKLPDDPDFKAKIETWIKKEIFKDYFRQRSQ